MEHGKDMGKLINEYEMTPVPEDGIERMETKIRQAKLDKRRAKRKKTVRRLGAGMAAALAVLFVLPNVNGSIAYAMEKLPVIGRIFEVITIRDYESEWDSENGRKELKVKVPEVVKEDQVNESVEAYVKELLERFEAERKESEEGYLGLDVDYEVLTNDEKWFSMDIAALETQASGYEFHRFYTVDKETNRILELKELFAENADYVSVISEEIIRQMKEDPDGVYWLEDTEIPLEDNFTAIKPDQSFYINQEGNLVIAFDEYEAAPGFMGALQFIIPKEVIEGILK